MKFRRKNILIFAAVILAASPILYFAFLNFSILVFPGFEARKTYRGFRATLSSNQTFQVVHCIVHSGGDWDPFGVDTTLRMKSGYFVDLQTIGVSTSDFEFNDFLVVRIYSLDKKLTNDLANFNFYQKHWFQIYGLPNYNSLYSKEFLSVADFFSNIDDVIRLEILPKDLQTRGAHLPKDLFWL